MSINLPPEALAYIRERNTFGYDPDTCECGHVVLLPESELRIDDFIVSGPETGLSLEETDPPWAEYTVRGVSMLESCDDYIEFGILSWMVDDKMFANWDHDHHNLVAFPGVTWADIVADPATYLSAQWRSDDYFEPWKHGYKPNS